MHTSTLRWSSSVLAITSLLSLTLLTGCDGLPQGATETALPDSTLSASVETEDLGRYDLVGRSAESENGEWQFTVRSGRAVATQNSLRFVWDFGDGQDYEGVEQAYQFTQNGTHTVTVTAYRLNNSVAFVLRLNIEVAILLNQIPLAIAGDNQTAVANDLVFLYGGASSDPDGDQLTYQWVQISGEPVLLLHANEATASFITPSLDSDNDLAFGLTVSDGDTSGQDTSVVHVLRRIVDADTVSVTADAGPPQLGVSEGQRVTLDGSGSYSSDGSPLTFAWSQVSGPSVVLIGAHTMSTTLLTPPVTGDPVELWFELVVSSGDVSDSDEVRIVVVSDDSLPPVDPCVLDLDEDGVTDCLDGCPADSAKSQPGVCGCGVAELDADGDATPDCRDGCPNDPAKLAAGVCGCGISDSIPDCGANCKESTTNWQNTGFAAQTGTFEIEFDAIPHESPMDGIFALARGSGTTHENYAVLVRFSEFGTIDARNGGAYSALTSVSYSPGTLYHFRVVVNVPARTYAVHVRPEGGTLKTIATNHAFRSEQSAITSLDHWGIWSWTGRLDACGVGVTGASSPLTASAGPNLSIVPGGSTTLQGSAVGGTPPYTYQWSPTAGLNNAAIAQPTANPLTTRTYALLVTDNAGNTATDTMTLTVQSSPLVASAGPDRTVSFGGFVTLGGGATGGTEPYTYRWSPATALSNASEAQPTASPSSTTTYTLTVTDAASRTASDSMVVTVSAAALTANAGTDRTITAGSSTTLAGSASGGTAPYSYRWSPSTGLSSTTIANPTASPASTTTYTLTVTDNASRTASDSVVITVSAAGGNTYYVSPTGSDSNPGSSSSPWRTIDHAHRHVGPGDTILLRGGTYPVLSEILWHPSLNQNGTPQQPITMKAAPGETVILDGQNTANYMLNFQNLTQWWVFEDFEIRNSRVSCVEIGGDSSGDNRPKDIVFRNIVGHHVPKPGGTVFSVMTSERITFANCKAYDGQVLFFAHGSKAASFIDCEAWDAGQDGFYASNISKDTVFLRCNAHECYDAGFDIGGTLTATDCVSHDHMSTASGADGVGFKCWDSQNSVPGGEIKLVRCRVYNVRRNGILCSVRTSTGDNGGGRGDNLVKIHNCTVANTKLGIWIGSMSDQGYVSRVEIKNTISSYAKSQAGDGGTRRALYVDTAGLLTAEQNNLWHRDPTDGGTEVIYYRGTNYTAAQVTSGAWRTQSGFGQGSIALDPLYVNYAARDLHLRLGSPCIDAGLPLGYSSIGAAPDMGAFEYNP